MALLIDSSVWIGLERRGLAPSDVGQLGSVVPPVIATVTIAELLVGVHRAQQSARRVKRLAFIEQILATVEIVTFDLPSAREYARVSAELTAAGTPIGQIDLLAASCALARVPDLIVLQPSWSN